ncbi:hypothetical protein COY95_05060 [Candidatus Woesearchaeota archaeon CG_4_10_14_0_8_um_filter_47_5]|nr:MAG: hypothetical protein COY95_05060 [Candidatus Woesearchaeota archaeon CG_4_10_14_0_8_um_filter_47_5]
MNTRFVRGFVRAAHELRRASQEPLFLVVVGIVVLVITFPEQGAALRSLFYLCMIVIAAAVNLIVYRLGSPVDLTPAYFFMILIAARYSVMHALVFLFAGSIIPAFFGGAGIEPKTIRFILISAVVCIMARLLNTADIVIVGIGLTLLNLIVVWITRNSISSDPMIFPLIHTSVTILYFVEFGHLVARIVG